MQFRIKPDQAIKSFLILLYFFLNFNFDSLAVNRYWVGPAGGAYSNAGNWNTASNGSGVPGTPVSSDTLIIDRSASILIDGVFYPSSLKIVNNAQVQFSTTSSRTLTIGWGGTAPAFIIESGSRLEVTGTAALTIDLYSVSRASIFGTLDFSGTSCKMNHPSGSITSVKPGGVLRYGGNSSGSTGTTATLFLDSNGVYEIYRNGGTIPTASYHPKSIIRCTGATTSAPLFLMNSSAGSYGIYEFNCPNYTGTGSVGNANLTFNDFNLLSTGSGKWLFSSNSLTGYRLTINGNLNIQPGCYFDVNNTGMENVLTEVRVLGNVNVF